MAMVAIGNTGPTEIPPMNLQENEGQKGLKPLVEIVMEGGAALQENGVLL